MIATEPEVVFTASFEPSVENPRDVLAFLLVNERTFVQPGDDLSQIRAIEEVVRDTKRDVLLRWHALHMRRHG